MGNVWVSLQISQSTGKFKKTHGMGKVWETDTHIFRIVWVNFSPYDFHPTVYFIIWEMHWFPYQFPIVEENAAKLIVGENLGNWSSYFSHIMAAFFPLDPHFMVYFIMWEMHLLSH